IPGARRRSDNPSEAKPEPQADRPANPKPAEPRQPPAEKSWQSLQDAMKKLSDIAQSGEKTSRNSANGANSKVLPESVEDPVGRPVPDPQIDGKKVPRDQSQQADSGNEAGQGSLQAFQDLLERFQNSQRNQSANTDDENTAMQDDVTPPQIQPGMRPPVTRNVPAPQSKNRSSQVLRRPDRTAPNEPPVSPDQRMTEQGELTPPNLFPLRIPPTSPTFPPPTSQPKSTLSQSGNQGRTTPPIDQRTGRPSGTSAASSSESESFLSVSEFLKEQLQNGIPIPNGDETSRNHGVRSGEVRPDAMPRSDVARSKLGSTELSNQATQPEKSNIDVRKELEQSGLRRTLEKIVQKAKEESNAQQRAQQESVAGHRGSTSSGAANKATPNGPQVQPNSSVDPSMQKSLTDLLGGLDDNMQDIVKDAKFRDRPSNRQQARDSAWQQSPRESESRLSKWNDAASGFLSDLSKAPQAPTRSLSPAGGNSAITSDAPLAIGSVFLVGSFLLGLAAVVAYFMRRPLLKLVANATGIAGPNRVQQPGEIRSRADVIAAFHELALNPKQLVESWWTHRAAAQKLAAESPQSKAAVDTLAEVYEQARYLPDDIELPPDSIQSARTAFAACR
ncbi:MAG: hypothetical protein O2856_16910, partial [Planctomycetota bacterium]|nr:hypothetical protein [Planctomycetota bacterium]